MKKLKGNIVIDLEDHKYFDYPPIEINSSIHKDTYNICFSIKNNEKLKDVIANPDNKKLLLQDCIDNIKLTSEFKDQQGVYKYCAKMLRKGIDIISECSSYTFMGTDAQIIEYINQNPEIAQLPFFVPNCYELSWEYYERAYYIYGRYSNARFLVDNNKHARITLDEYKRTLELIDEIVDKTNSYNFSTLEKIMYVYDYVRDRYYNAEEATEDTYVSRGITHVLLGDKIVCEGFVNLFNVILKRLNIPCAEFVLSTKDLKHARSLVYICDDKYDVAGLYKFDPTFGCKKDDGFNHMLSYKYFAKTPKQMMEYDNGRYEYDTYPYFDEFMLEDLIDNNEKSQMGYYHLCKTGLFYNINYIMKLINDSTLKEDTFYSADYVFDKMYYINDLASEVIDCNKFARLLFNVRRVQSLEDPIKYTEDVRMLSVILSRSELPYPVKDQYDKLLQEVCGYKTISVSDALYCIISNVLQNEFVSIEEKNMILSKIKRS